MPLSLERLEDFILARAVLLLTVLMFPPEADGYSIDSLLRRRRRHFKLYEEASRYRRRGSERVMATRLVAAPLSLRGVLPAATSCQRGPSFSQISLDPHCLALAWLGHLAKPYVGPIQ